MNLSEFLQVYKLELSEGLLPTLPVEHLDMEVIYLPHVYRML